MHFHNSTKINALLTLMIVAPFCGTPARAITVTTVSVGNPGNPADMRYIDSYHPSGVGSVSYSFNIGMTEVTNAQYVAFLNATGQSDPYGLYSTSMGSAPIGGILRSGVSGTYTYSVKAPALSGAYTYDNKPVVYVDLGDAMRFANWLQNGQPMGTENANTTEDGAYSLNAATNQSSLSSISRNSGARWWIPSESEWYKAAYYNPGTGSYFDYPIRSNTVPEYSLPTADSGNSANSWDGCIYDACAYRLTDVGAYILSSGPYGTFDQGANVWEFNEAKFDGLYRGIRGGSWADPSSSMVASYWFANNPTFENPHIGFRVATVAIPEPSLLALTLLMATNLCALLRNRKRN